MAGIFGVALRGLGMLGKRSARKKISPTIKSVKPSVSKTRTGRVKPISQTDTLHNLQANQRQAQAMTTENLQAQAIVYLQTTDAYLSTPQAQKNFWDA